MIGDKNRWFLRLKSAELIQKPEISLVGLSLPRYYIYLLILRI